jgi:hypothetical protein
VVRAKGIDSGGDTLFYNIAYFNMYIE